MTPQEQGEKYGYTLQDNKVVPIKPYSISFNSKGEIVYVGKEIKR